MPTFAEDLQAAALYHGHICSGQIIGVRMARLALQTLEIQDPHSFRDLIVYVESDRCITDAIGTVTGCKLGKRNLKWFDFGKTAATFLNLQTGQAVRIYRKYRLFPPEGADLVEFFCQIPDAAMFTIQDVKVSYRPEDLPGKPLTATTCAHCGEEVIDGRQVLVDSVALCKACAFGAYYHHTAD